MLATVLAAAALAVLVPAMARAAVPVCPDGSICLWEDPDFQGESYVIPVTGWFIPEDPPPYRPCGDNLPARWYNRVESLYNNVHAMPRPAGGGTEGDRGIVLIDHDGTHGPVSYGLALPRKAYADLGAGGDKIDEIRPWYRPECTRYYPPLAKEHGPRQ